MIDALALESLPPLTSAPIGPCHQPPLDRLVVQLAHVVDVEALVVDLGDGVHSRSQNGFDLDAAGASNVAVEPAGSLLMPLNSVRGPGTVRNVR